MMYLDTNVIVYAIENHSTYGKACEHILLDIQNKKLHASSSFLNLVELLNVLVKINRRRRKEGRSGLDIKKSILAVLSLPITWLELDFTVIERASTYDYRVSGVDYTHIATMEVHGIHSLLSADRELDRIDFIKRIDPLRYRNEFR